MKKQEMHRDLLNSLIKRFSFKEQKGYLRAGICPACNKKELFTSIENPWVVRCGRENNCGWSSPSRDLFPELFSSWSDRFESSNDNPNAAAEAYLQQARGLDTSKLRGAFTQGSFHKDGKGSATVRFTLDVNTSWERLIDNPQNFDRKAHFTGGFAGKWWSAPHQNLSNENEIWLTEGIFDALSLNQNGVAAVSIMTAKAYPSVSLAELAKCFEGRERPLLIWALDNGPAGEEAIKAHVKRSKQEGWRTAAALPSMNGSGNDWNDLHIKGKLTAQHRKNYRFYGSLLLAQNAHAKALMMFEHSERQEFHFEFNHCVYWFKLDIERHMKAVERLMNDRNITDENEARHKALKESGAIKEIANCNPAPLYYMRSEVTDESWYYFRITFPGNTPAVKDSFTAGQISSASEFKKRLLHVAKGALYR